MDERQFNYLREMEIPLWVSRGDDAHDAHEEHHAHQEIPDAAPHHDTSTHPVAEIQSVAPLAEQPQAPLEESSPLDWEGLQGVVSQCQRCSELASQRTQTVFGAGHPQADWLIIGEAPGAEEDRQGEPFIGKAGQLLNGMLHAIGLQRSQVYMAHILKCRPPDDRDPKVDEIEACYGYLQRQIELIQPKMILAVGAIAAQSLLKSSEPVDKLRAKVHRLESGMPLVVTYHPTYLLHSPLDKRKAWQDLKLALSAIEQS